MNGGECLIFDIIDEIKVAFKDDKDMYERILPNIWPDQLNQIDKGDKEKLKKFYLEYSILKITTRMAKLGKEVKYIYDTLDKDRSGSCILF